MNSQHKALQSSCTKFSPTCFGRFCSHLQANIIITRTQRTKCC